MKKTIIILTIIVLVIASIIGVLRFSGVKFVLYEAYSLFLYDHIMYNGRSYFISGSDLVSDGFVNYNGKVFNLNVDDIIQVYVVDRHNKPFDETMTSDAMTYHGDDEILFIYYNGGVYTRVPEYIHEHYLDRVGNTGLLFIKKIARINYSWKFSTENPLSGYCQYPCYLL